MENSLTIALARQSVLARQMDVIATNLANLETAGFKSEHMIFTEHLEQTETGELLSLVHDVSFMRDLAPGPLVGTNSSLDLALHGDGYFAVDTPEGPRYTRHGIFQLDDNGQIVTTEGNSVLGLGGAPMTVPTDTSTITVTRDGIVSADAEEIGRVQIVRFEDERALTKIGSSLYDAGEQQPQPATTTEVFQGMVENSNVKGVVEITRMIDTVRAYQSASQLSQTEHDRILEAIEALMAPA